MVFVCNRDADSANIFMRDIASRLKKNLQLNTDGLKPYLEAVDNTFQLSISHVQLVKLNGK